MRSALALVATLLVMTPLARAQIVLLPGEELVEGAGLFQLISVAGGDFDEDEHVDLVTYAPAPIWELSFHRGDGAGSFASIGAPLSLTAGALGAVIDVDADEHLDLVLTDLTPGPGLAHVALGAGDGTFAAPLTVTLPQFADNTTSQLAVGHLDPGGTVDLVASVRLLAFEQVVVFSGVGDGTFTGLQVLPALSLFTFVLSIDLIPGAADGVPDLALGVFSPTASSVRFYAGLGGGLFATEPTAVPLPWPAADIAVGDINDDGLVDIVASNVTNGLAVRLGRGGTVFGAPIVTALAGEPGQLALVDLDGDGRQDVVVGRIDPDDLAALRSLGDGTFAAPVILSGGRAPSSAPGNVARADMDEDGLPDLALASGLALPNQVLTVPNATYAAGEPFLDLGSSLAGTNGYPVLLAEGTLVPGEPFGLSLLNGLPGAGPALVVGFSLFGGPLFGGTLWPSPERILLMAVTDGDGTSSFTAPWPSGLAGIEMWLQAWLPDAAGPAGWASTSGVRAQSP